MRERRMKKSPAKKCDASRNQQSATVLALTSL
jgi:hypothetical protein